MEARQDPYSHEEEVKGLSISVGNEEIQLNGHQERIEPL